MQLDSLVGSPYEVTGVYDCAKNNIKSLEGISAIIGSHLHASNNKIESLEGVDKYLKEVNGYIIIGDNPIKSHLLGLLKIKNLKGVALYNSAPKEVEDILNKYIKGNKDIFDCQSELIDAGFEELAKL